MAGFWTIRCRPKGLLPGARGGFGRSQLLQGTPQAIVGGLMPGCFPHYSFRQGVGLRRLFGQQQIAPAIAGH